MGQYYRPTFLKKERKENEMPIMAQLSSYDFGQGAKLMEHSYVGNPLVQAVEYLLAQDKEGVPFVWSGDYAENFEGFDTNLFDIGDTEEIDNKTLKTMPLVETDGWCGKRFEINPNEIKTYKYVINHTKGLYVEIPQQGEYTIHPLPLLTAESNGLGGGDYWSKKDAELVGSWKYDTISVGDEIPSGFKKLKVKFKE